MTAVPGVYYRPEDYIGVARRLLIDVVDVPIAVLLSVLALGALTTVAPAAAESGAVLLLIGGVWFGYFVLLKRSRFRTLGYVIAGARIVNLRGETPSIGSLLARLLFAVAGPFNFVFDLLWLTGDQNRQALRDKFATTYVVKAQATPAGAGTIVHRTYMFWGMTFIFQEVTRARGMPAPPKEVTTVTTGSVDTSS